MDTACSRSLRSGETQNATRARAVHGGLETMAAIYNGVVFGGLGVFSKNIKYQLPHLVWQFPDIKDIHPGSINVQLDTPLQVETYDCTTLPIPWLDVDNSGQVLGW